MATIHYITSILHCQQYTWSNHTVCSIATVFTPAVGGFGHLMQPEVSVQTFPPHQHHNYKKLSSPDIMPATSCAFWYLLIPLFFNLNEMLLGHGKIGSVMHDDATKRNESPCAATCRNNLAYRPIRTIH